MTNAIATLLFTDSYLPGALILSKTLRQLGLPGDIKLVILLATTLTDFQYQQLAANYDEIIEIKSINANRNSDELKLLQRPELFQTFSKINVFKLTQFEKLLYLDSDTLPLQPVHQVLNDFDITENDIVASPDSGWPDIFNSGVFLIKPSLDTYDKLLNKIANSATPSFDGADQGLLNEFFQIDAPSRRQWIRLPFLYNVTPSIHYQYQPAYQFFENQIRLIHFIGPVKPWNEPGLYGNLRDKWWLKYIEFYGHDLNTQKTINGIDPVLFDPEYSHSRNQEEGNVENQADYREPSYEEHHEHPQEENDQRDNEYNHSKDNVEILTNPDSYQYFETIQDNTDWNPANEEPPKNGKPEAEHFPSDLNQYRDWQETPQYNHEEHHEHEGTHYQEEEHAVELPQPEYAPPPIFPWEYENRKVPATRVFNNAASDFLQFDDAWESLPLLKKIRDKKQQEEENRERLRKSSAVLDENEAARLKELERFYKDIEQSGPANGTGAGVPDKFADEDEGLDDIDRDDDDAQEKSLDKVVEDLYSLHSDNEHSAVERAEDLEDGSGADENEFGDDEVEPPLIEEPDSAVAVLSSGEEAHGSLPGSKDQFVAVDEDQLERQLLEELGVEDDEEQVMARY